MHTNTQQKTNVYQSVLTVSLTEYHSVFLVYYEINRRFTHKVTGNITILRQDLSNHDCTAPVKP